MVAESSRHDATPPAARPDRAATGRRLPAGPPTRWRICTPDGTVVALHVRQDYTDGSKRLWWERTDGARGLGGLRLGTLPLYGTERLRDIADDATVLVAEGEKDADAVNRLALPDLVAVGTVTGAATIPAAPILAPLLRFRRVLLWADADQPGEAHMAGIATGLAAAGHRDVRRVHDPGATPGAGDGAADFVRRGGDAAALRAFVDAAEPITPAAEPAKPEGGGHPPRVDRGPDRATELLTLAQAAGAEAFTSDGQPYVSVRIAGHVETYPLGPKSPAARQYLLRLYRQWAGRLPGKDALTAAVEALAAEARFGGHERAVYLRVGRDEAGRTVIDRGGPEWSAFSIGPDGWHECPHPVRFRRTRTMSAHPEPTRNGSIEELRPFLNVTDDADWRLVVVWLVAALRPVGPYPVLVLHGEQGTAKSTAAAFLRAVVDPSVAPLRTVPKDVRDLFVGARNNWCLPLNNVSAISAGLSDALCQLSTGGGFPTRELYSDDEEVVLGGQRPVLVNSIEHHPISQDRRRSERELWDDFGRARPRILGAVLALMAGAERELPGVRLTERPRMADFAELGVAVETAEGWPRGCFLAAYSASALASAETALAAFPIVPRLIEIAEAGAREGTAADLLEELRQREGRSPEELRRVRGWPSSPRALAGQFVRLAPALRQSRGVTVEALPRTKSARGWRVGTPIGREQPSPPSSPSPVSSNQGDRGDGEGLSGDGPSLGGHGRQPSARRAATGDGGAGRVTVESAATVTHESPSFEFSTTSEDGPSDGGDGLSSFTGIEIEGSETDRSPADLPPLSDAATEDGLAVLFRNAETGDELSALGREFAATIARLPADRQARLRAAIAQHRTRLSAPPSAEPAPMETP